MCTKDRICCLFMLIAATLTYAFVGGDGSVGNPYQISTRADLEAVNNDLAANYILVNDIDLAGITYTQAVISPDTSTADDFQGTPFTGKFNGNGYIIKTVKITASSKDYTGLFGQISQGGAVTNLGVVDCVIYGLNFVGGLCGYNDSGTITSSYAKGVIKGASTSVLIGGYNVGGLCGYNKSGTITSSYSTCVVTGDQYVGGLCGSNFSGTITSSYTAGELYGGLYLGGLCGANYGTITLSYSTCSVTGDYLIATDAGYCAGGLCGYNRFGQITLSYATGEVDGDMYVGGLCGYNDSGTITSSYAVGEVYGDQYVGGFCGYNKSGTITSSFWDMQTSGKQTSNGGTGKTTAQMKDINTFLSAGWDFDDIWLMSDINSEFEGYPILSWQNDIMELSLVEGLNWISFNVLPENPTLENVFAGHVASGNDFIISGNGHNATYIGGSWIGTLSTIEPGLKYNIYSAIADTFSVQGNYVDAATPINLVTGWNWLGYCNKQAEPLAECLSTLQATNNDFITSADGKNATYIAGNWYGALQTLEPGKGYMLHVSKPQTFSYCSIFASTDFYRFSLLAKYWGFADFDPSSDVADVDWYRDGIIDEYDLLQLAVSWCSNEIEILAP